LLGAAGWYTAAEHFGRSARVPGQPGAGLVTGGPVNLLRCTPGELRAVLSRRIAEPDLSKVQEAILEWRKAIDAEQRGSVFLAELVRPTSGSAGPVLLDAEVYRSLRPYWVVKEASEALRTWLEYLGLLLVSFLLAHLVFRFTDFQGSEVLLPLALLLCGTSTILLFTFTDPLRERLLYAPFVSGVAPGCIGLTIAARFVSIQALEKLRNVFLTVGIVLSLMLVFLGGGPAGTDAKLNLFRLFQPVEFIKILVVLFLAGYFTGRDLDLRQREALRWRGFLLPHWRDVIPVVLFLAATLSLFFLQRDLGPALILFLVFLGMFAMTRRRVVVGLAGLTLLLSGFWAAYRFRLLQTVAIRIEMWLSPWDNHRPGGVQLAESLWALASGGFWGAGPGRGDPQYIPAGHTDLILAAAGEVLGFPGLAAILAVLVLLFGMMIYFAWRSRGNYGAYLGFGLALLFGIQTAVVAAGTVGVIPLSGVPIPFMSYGKSAVIADFILLGLMLNISSTWLRGRETRAKIPSAALAVPVVAILVLACVVLRASQIMSYQSDEILCKGSLTPQQDGVRRFTYNRRLLDIAAQIPRGSILDRSGIPLATSRQEDLARAMSILKDLGMEALQPIVGRRFYPFGPFTVQVLGHTRGYWVDPKTVERSEDSRLRGYPGANEVVLVDGKKVIRQDLSALAPAFRDRFSLSSGKLEDFENRDKNVNLTLDARMQVIALRALERNLPKIDGVARTKGAAAVLDASTGEILACVSLPTYDPNTISESDLEKIYGSETKAAYDRARFEIYPPGATFGIAVGAAALEEGWPGQTKSGGFIVCRHVDDIPWQYNGTDHRRRVTDNEAESAHGRLDLRRAFVTSCNVYFAWLGTQLGPERLFEYARNRFQLELKGVNNAQDLAANLPDNAYGQAKITASPLHLAAMAAAVANGGYRVEPNLISTRGASQGSKTRVLGESTAAALKEWMQQVVQSGTGSKAAVQGWVVGGKTGTAQNDIGDKRPHSWFVGFAYPSHSGPEDAIAFAFLIENGGYGGRAASQAAHDFLAASHRIWRSSDKDQ
jgi:cell division protein FtsI/penicillin-binding protein 2/cell division protein FtsW (lipid II flippase)